MAKIPHQVLGKQGPKTSVGDIVVGIEQPKGNNGENTPKKLQRVPGIDMRLNDDDETINVIKRAA